MMSLISERGQFPAINIYIPSDTMVFCLNVPLLHKRLSVVPQPSPETLALAPSVKPSVKLAVQPSCVDKQLVMLQSEQSVMQSEHQSISPQSMGHVRIKTGHKVAVYMYTGMGVYKYMTTKINCTMEQHN